MKGVPCWRTAAALGIIGALLSTPANVSGQELLVVEKRETDRAIIFVHGLCGSPRDTFHAEGTDLGWPEMLASDGSLPSQGPALTEYSVYAVDYTASFQANMTVDTVARHVAATLENSDVFRRYNHLWFITHSLGGLAIKQMILEHNAANKKKYLDRVAGVFFLGVPHKGSGIANLAERTPSSIVKAIFCDNYQLVTDLRTVEGNAFLNDLDRRWQLFVRSRERVRVSPRIYCAYEQLDTTFAMIVDIRVVKQVFSDTFCSELMEPVPRDHQTIVKPVDRNDLIYLWVRKRIFDSAIDLKTDRAHRWENAQNQSLKERIVLYNKWHSDPRFRDPSGLPEVDENIQLIAPSTMIEEAFRVLGEEYEAPTLADLFERVAQQNRCLGVDVSKDRRQIRLSIPQELKHCSYAGREMLICPDANCPSG